MKPINDISELLRKEAIPHEIDQMLEWGGDNVVRLYYPKKSKPLVELTYGAHGEDIMIEFSPIIINGVRCGNRNYRISKEAAHKLITMLYTELK